jgi:2-hydroxymuconate-semialdehyde hydrolase
LYDEYVFEALILKLNINHIENESSFIEKKPLYQIEKAHFIGHDLGGGIAQILAINYSERVISIVIADGVCFANWPLPKVAAMRWPTAPEFEPGPSLIQEMIRGGVFKPEILTPIIYGAFTLPFSSPSGPEELQRASFALNHHQTEDLVPALSNIKVYTTLLWGQYDRYLPSYWGKQLQQVIPNSVLKILPECSHYSMLDNPLLFSQEVLNHLANCKRNSV